MTELPDETHQQIQRLSAEGDSLAEAARYPDALAKYWAAWELLPEPKTDWEAATCYLVQSATPIFLLVTSKRAVTTYRLPCTAPTQSEIRSFISGSDNVNSNLAIMIVPLMNWPARTWPRVIASS